MANHISLRSIAHEPQVKDALPWLDADSRDDRILASFVEAMRAHPRSVVALGNGEIPPSTSRTKPSSPETPTLSRPTRQNPRKRAKLAPGIVALILSVNCVLKSAGSFQTMWLYWRVSK